MAELFPRRTPGAQVTETSPGEWRLSIPSGPAGVYRWAQLDDYMHLPRREFKWRKPFQVSLQARISDPYHAGTWGFGVWNDPFSMGAGIQGARARLPALPNTAWFFFTSPPNHLSFQNNTPANGMLAGVFSSKPVTLLRLLPLGFTLPLALFTRTSALARRALQKRVREDFALVEEDWAAWHDFSVQVQPDRTVFLLNGQICHQTGLQPCGRLGLVLWIDNQYARFAPGERLRTGTLATLAETWLELRSISIQ